MTNKKRAGKIPKKCINDLHRGEIRCTGNDDEYAYAFDNKLSPRCGQPDDMKGRSVYYALRKNTKCKTPVARTKPTKPIKPETVQPKSEVLRSRMKAMEEFYQKTMPPQQKATNPLKRQRQEKFKAKYLKTMENSLGYQLREDKKKQRNGDEVNNEILINEF